LLRFVRPEELQEWLKGSGCQTNLIHGLFYWPVFDEWTWMAQPTVNYALQAKKLP